MHYSIPQPKYNTPLMVFLFLLSTNYHYWLKQAYATTSNLPYS